jgi:PAS domain S-box-containing protein
VASSADSIISADEQLQIVQVNPAAEALFGRRAEDMLGQPLASLWPERHREAQQRILTQFARSGDLPPDAANPVTMTARLDSNERRAVEVSLARATVDGQVRLHLFVRDISERLRLDTARRDAEHQAFEVDRRRALGQMAGGIAHTLNQALGLVSGYSEMARVALRRLPPDIQNTQELLDVVTNAAFSGGEAVRRLLDYARRDSDGPSDVIDVEELLEDVARQTAQRWTRSGNGSGEPIEMMVSVSTRPVIRGRSADLRDALASLVFNAVDTLPSGGRIELIARPDAAETVIAVSDTGVGMSTDLRQRAFEPFFSTKQERGTGLGLPTVVRIVEQHGGRVEIDSVLGSGTTVRLLLPSAGDAPADSAVASATPVSPAANLATVRPKRVLAVDDDPALARLVGLMLSPRGHTVVTTTSGEAALARLALEPFDIVISDLSMGEGMNGWELAEQVRDRWPGVRFALVTGWGVDLDPAKARELNIEAIVAKPYRVSVLDKLLQD